MMLLVGGTAQNYFRLQFWPRKRVMRGEFNTSNERRTVFFRTKLNKSFGRRLSPLAFRMPD